MSGAPLADLFSPGARIAEGPPRLCDELLFPQERACVANAVEKRRAEFGTARLLARAALAELGVEAGPLVPRPDRSPTWPPGVVGSISHTSDHCAVVVHHQSVLRSVGLDVETLRPLAAGIGNLVLTAPERSWLGEHPPERHNDLTLLCFSAKEAYYKCQSPLTGGFLDFRDVELEVDLEAGRFVARVLRPGWSPLVARLPGRFILKAGKVFCGVELRA